MVAVSTVRASNARLRTLPSLTAVFAGGTSGIGESALRALAANSAAPSIYLIGRSESRAALIIDDCLKLCPEGTFTFLKADLTLLKNVDTVCADILQREEGGKIDLLFMSQGYLTFEGRKDTSEGLDALMTLRYYSRMRLLSQLLPLLLSSPSPRAISIFAANHEARVYPTDLSLRTHYGLFTHVSHVAFMTTFFFSALCAQHPTLSCLHVFPGLVKTAEFENGLFPNWMKWFFRWVMLPLITPFTVSVPESGERNLFMATSARFRARQWEGGEAGTMVPVDGAEVATDVDGNVGGGVYAVNWDGEVFKQSESFYREWNEKGLREKVWEHTMKAFETIEKGGVFLD